MSTLATEWEEIPTTPSESAKPEATGSVAKWFAKRFPKLPE